MSYLDWRAGLAAVIEDAVGPRVGTPETRAQFGALVAREAMLAVVRGSELEREEADLNALKRAAQRAHAAMSEFARLSRELNFPLNFTTPHGDVLSGAFEALETWPERFDAPMADVAYLAEALERRRQEAAARHPRRRGPRNAASVEVASLIGRFYVAAFGRQPKHVNRGAVERLPKDVSRRKGLSSVRSGVAQTPFDRACDAVEQYLIGHPLSQACADLRLSDKVRADAAKDAR